MTVRFDWRHQYDDDRDAYEREITDIDTGTESLVQQQYVEETDINVLVKRLGISDRMPAPAVDPRFYGDMGNIVDLRTALDTVREAREHFDALPAPLRARFQNNPALLFDFVNDPANVEEAIKLGVLARERTPEPAPAPVPGSDSAGNGGAVTS